VTYETEMLAQTADHYWHTYTELQAAHNANLQQKIEHLQQRIDELGPAVAIPMDDGGAV
jgi:hypothetical protein